MKTIKSAVLILFLAASFSFAQTSWGIDNSHSKIGFSVTHLVITEVDGFFKDFNASVISDEESFEGSKIEFTAKTASIFTDNTKRDEHLRSDDFFNAEKFPNLTFVSKSFTKVNDKKYKLVGDLSIRDVTKEVVLDVVYNGTIKDPWGNTKAGFKLNGVINRFDYGLKWNAAIETGGLVVGENVKINANLELVQK